MCDISVTHIQSHFRAITNHAECHTAVLELCQFLIGQVTPGLPAGIDVFIRSGGIVLGLYLGSLAVGGNTEGHLLAVVKLK